MGTEREVVILNKEKDGRVERGYRLYGNIHHVTVQVGLVSEMGFLGSNIV